MGIKDFFDIEFFLVINEIWRGTIVDILTRELRSDMGMEEDFIEDRIYGPRLGKF